MNINEDRLVRLCLVLSVMILIIIVVVLAVMAVIGLWTSGGWRALLAGWALLWLFMLLVRRVERYVVGKGWL